jgi:hypothetical protein
MLPWNPNVDLRNRESEIGFQMIRLAGPVRSYASKCAEDESNGRDSEDESEAPEGRDINDATQYDMRFNFDTCVDEAPNKLVIERAAELVYKEQSVCRINLC